jgi:hypothetical protein
MKLTTTDAFYVVDLDGAERAAGIVRWAKKVLVDGATNLARQLTYSYASLGLQVSGASAGINSDPDGRAAAIDAFVTEVAPLPVRFDAGKGVTADELTGLTATDDRSTQRGALHDILLAVSLSASATAALGSLDGKSIALEPLGDATDVVSGVFTSAGATVTLIEVGQIDATADILAVGSKVGLLDHHNLASVRAGTILPTGPLPITARGLATAARAGVTVLPDFITIAGPLLAQWPEADATPDSLRAGVDTAVTGAIRDVADHPDGIFLGAAQRAEEFLLTWRDALPLARPIA